MREFQPFLYIKKHMVPLILFCFLMTGGLYVGLNILQTYTAQVTIEYVYEGADHGYAPDGTELDTSEVYSSAVISRVLDNLNMDQKDHPIDSIRSAVSVEQVEDEEVDAVNTALNEDGESSDLEATKYTISYVVNWQDGSQLPELAQSVLDEILDVYFTLFSEKYINQSTIVNSISGLDRSGYDYIEQAELIQSALSTTLEQLSQRAELAPGFYSAETGYSYSDLADEVQLLSRSQLTPLFAYILNHQVTRDREALLAKYGQRVKDLESEQERYDIRIDEVERILDAYVEKLRVSNNTAQSEIISSEGRGLLGGNVIGDVEYPAYTDESGQFQPFDQTTEYEMLLQSWIDISDSYDSSVVDRAYYQYVIDCFEGDAEKIEAYQRDPAHAAESESRDLGETPAGEGAADLPEAEGGSAQGTEQPEGAAQAADEEASDESETQPREAEVVSDEQIRQVLTGDSDVYVEIPKSQTPEDIAYVEGKISSILQRMEELYDQIEVTGSEFNDYMGAEYIRMVSSNRVIEGMNVPLYTMVGAVLFLVLGCSGVILLSRIGDIIEYIAYTDHRLRMSNRAACDRFIDRNQERILPTGFGCACFQIVNQNEINRKLGREEGDGIFRLFVSSIKNICGEKGEFIGYNGSGQFILFLSETNDIEMEKLCTDLKILLDESLAEKHVTLRYSVGLAETESDDQYRIRPLLSRAISRKVTYEAGVDSHGGKEK